jgi:hypothetical protein
VSHTRLAGCKQSLQKPPGSHVSGWARCRPESRQAVRTIAPSVAECARAQGLQRSQPEQKQNIHSQPEQKQNIRAKEKRWPRRNAPAGADLGGILSEAQLRAVNETLDGPPVNATVNAGPPVVQRRHVEAALAVARPSLPAAEASRLAAVYARFRQDRVDRNVRQRLLSSLQRLSLTYCSLFVRYSRFRQERAPPRAGDGVAAAGGSAGSAASAGAAGGSVQAGAGASGSGAAGEAAAGGSGITSPSETAGPSGSSAGGGGAWALGAALAADATGGGAGPSGAASASGLRVRVADEGVAGPSGSSEAGGAAAGGWAGGAAGAGKRATLA